MRLSDFGIDERDKAQDCVAILVGPNGSGKSFALLKLAQKYRHRKSVSVICNTAYDRFSGLRGVSRISSGWGRRSPSAVIKNSVCVAIETGRSEFYQLGKILEYCGYKPRIGFKAVLTDEFQINIASLDFYTQKYTSLPDDMRESLSLALDFFKSEKEKEIAWMDPEDSSIGFLRSQHYISILKVESILRKEKILRRIEVYLENHKGTIIQLSDASSGELSLISSLFHMITTVDPSSIILIDEPENSLHPAWQRDYLDKVLAALEYRNIIIVAATHSPIVVSGALSRHRDLINVFRMENGHPRKLEISSRPNAMEEILWRAFEVITPANHFVSTQIADAIDKYDNGEISKADVISILDKMENISFDRKQIEFYSAVRDLLNKVEAKKERGE